MIKNCFSLLLLLSVVFPVASRPPVQNGNSIPRSIKSKKHGKDDSQQHDGHLGKKGGKKGGKKSGKKGTHESHWEDASPTFSGGSIAGSPDCKPSSKTPTDPPASNLVPTSAPFLPTSNRTNDSHGSQVLNTPNRVAPDITRSPTLPRRRVSSSPSTIPVSILGPALSPAGNAPLAPLSSAPSAIQVSSQNPSVTQGSSQSPTETNGSSPTSSSVPVSSFSPVFPPAMIPGNVPLAAPNLDTNTTGDAMQGPFFSPAIPPTLAPGTSPLNQLTNRSGAVVAPHSTLSMEPAHIPSWGVSPAFHSPATAPHLSNSAHTENAPRLGSPEATQPASLPLEVFEPISTSVSLPPLSLISNSESANNDSNDSPIDEKEQEYTSTITTLVIEGDIDLIDQEELLFQMIDEEMRLYLMATFGSVLKDFELSITFYFPSSRNNQRSLQQQIHDSGVLHADMVVVLDVVDTKLNSQQEIDSRIRGFFQFDSLNALLRRMKQRGVDVKALSSESASTDNEHHTSSQSGRKPFFTIALAGGIAVVGISVAACFCKKRVYCLEQEESDNNSNTAVCLKSGPYLSSTLPESLLIVSYEEARNHKRYMLDAADKDTVFSRKQDVGFSILDGPDLLASTTCFDNEILENDAHSVGNSTTYSRSGQLHDDHPRPEYDSKVMGQRFRPWDSGIGNRHPVKKSRLMRPFQPTLKNLRHPADDIDELSMKPLVSRSRMATGQNTKADPLAPLPEGRQDKL